MVAHSLMYMYTVLSKSCLVKPFSAAILSVKPEPSASRPKPSKSAHSRESGNDVSDTSAVVSFGSRRSRTGKSARAT